MKTYLLCDLQGQRFAFDVELVEETVRMPWVTQIAETPPDVCGVVNYRGSTIAVVDPGQRLMGKRSRRDVDSYLVVIRVQADPVALVVDRVDGLAQGVAATPPKGAASPSFVLGHLEDEQGLVTVLDVPELLRPDVRAFVARARNSEAPPP